MGRCMYEYQQIDLSPSLSEATQIRAPITSCPQVGVKFQTGVEETKLGCLHNGEARMPLYHVNNIRAVDNPHLLGDKT